mgnify:CR=1 FL=1
MSTDKIFIGRYIGIQTRTGTIDKFFLSEEDVLKLQDHIENKGERSGRGVNIIFWTGQKSGKPYITIDTWKPDPNYKKQNRSDDTHVGGEKVSDF